MLLINSAPPGMGLPRRVEAHNSDFTLVAARQLRDGGLDLAHPITAKASLATGETIVSSSRGPPVIRPPRWWLASLVSHLCSQA